ncbi:MAG: EAL domain-containing protein [Bacillus sp. (in: Bacteria)]|nr:EAL domain-containing protein [Bacillus sp. (in: firmicutes)]MCM1426329.1 EAL domain-containing protein [Eubacterium sp.]
MKTREKWVFRISTVIVLLGICVLAFVWYSGILKSELRELVRNTLKEVSNQNVLVVQKEIGGDINALTEIAERIGSIEEDDDEVMRTLKAAMERYSFKRMGFARTDGMAHTTDGLSYDVSDSAYYQTSIRGETYISDLFLDPTDNEEIIVFSMPVKNEEEVIGIVIATYRVESLKEVLAVTSFEGEGYTYIVRRDGSKIVDSVNETSFQNMTNIFTSMEEADKRNDKVVHELKRLMESNKTGYVIFYNKIGKYMYATPLGINDWFLIDVVPVDFMESTSNVIIHRTYLICAVLAVICVLAACLIFREERSKKQQMQNLLYVDELTGGSTLAKFKLDVSAKIAEGHDNAALVVMDLDDFKLINELFGYDEGDKVLGYIWKTIQDNCRKEELAGRGAADHFMMWLFYDKKKDIEDRIIELNADIQHCFMPKNMDYILHPIFGIYYVDRYDEDVDGIIDCATLAHNHVKQEKSGIYKVYSEIMKERIVEKKQLSDQIEHAYENHEFVAFYQPKYDSKTQRLAGAEALIRWRKPNGQMISPGLFIPHAEESGFVRKLDEYIFKEVCMAQRRWLDKGLPIVPISVNISRRLIETPEFIDEYKKILDDSGVPIEYIQLEITESAILDKQDELINIMEKLHQIGFVILMDDFGTGYSSLMMLKSVPVDVMKLDKSFVDDYDDVKGERIIRRVMQMAQDLHIEVTAEGVETKDQYEFLKGIDCNMIQGYYFARPMPEEEFEECMHKEKAVVS